MTVLYSFNADTRKMQIHSRDSANQVIATLDEIDIYTSNQIARALDRIYADGLRAGKVAVLDAVNHATNQIFV